MGKRRENMLEAFKASHDQTVRNRQVAEAVEAARQVRSGGLERGGAGPEAHSELQGLPSVTPGGPRRGGADAELHEPVLEGPPRRAASLERDGSSGRGEVVPVREALSAEGDAGKPEPETDGLLLPMGLTAFLAVQVLILAVAFGLGWIASGADRGATLAEGAAGMRLDLPGTEGPASAGLNSPLRGGRTPTALDSWSASGLEGQGQAGADAGTELDPSVQPADLAFDDPASRFTVVVAQYNDTVFGRARAWEAFEFLSSQGLPMVSPRARNRVVFLFAGASAERAKLDRLLVQVRGQADVSGRKTPFYDAYVTNISRYL